nr:hypothetical protein [Oscillospiraceae bacterium]
ARLCPPKEEGSADAAELDWLLRNSEILRGYFLHLMDEDVRCRGPLRRALDEGDPRKIEAARQSAVAVCGEVINMSGQCLDLCVRLLPFCDASAAPYVLSAADLAHGAGRAAVPYILRQGDFSTDETYRYVLRRENELTLRQQQTAYDSIRAALA